jgi:hypothetical protein
MANGVYLLSALGVCLWLCEVGIVGGSISNSGFQLMQVKVIK